MAVKQFELFHGAVLTKLLRSDRPVSLRMIETRPAEKWSAYTINTAVDLFVKHATTYRVLSRADDGRSWSFVFAPDQLQQMAQSRASRPVYAALVCASQNLKDDTMQICLLKPRELEELIDTSSTTSQQITVRYEPGLRLQLFKGQRVIFKVPQNRLDNWDVPGG